MVLQVRRRCRPGRSRAPRAPRQARSRSAVAQRAAFGSRLRRRAPNSALGLPLSIPYWKGTKPKVTVRYGAPIRTNGADLASLSADFWAALAKLRAQGGGPPQPLAQLRSRL
jgi:hypothetical protein